MVSVDRNRLKEMKPTAVPGLVIIEGEYWETLVITSAAESGAPIACQALGGTRYLLFQLSLISAL